MIENEFAKFYIQDGLLYFIYKEGTHLDLDAVKKVVKDRLTAQHGEPYRVICDMSGLKNVEKEARDYLAREGSKDVIAVALTGASTAQRLMTNFYLAVSKPAVPTKVFATEEEAKSFLSKY